MPPLRFDEVAKLVSHSRVTRIDYDNPEAQDGNKWILYRGVNKVPNFEYDFSILYLSSEATRESIAAATKALSDPGKTQVVYAASLEKKFKLREMTVPVRGRIHQVQSVREYLFSFLQDQLSKYQAKLSELSPRDYIDPLFEVPSGFETKRPNPLVLYMEMSSTEEKGTLAVLLGEAGQGKTYSARYAVSELIKHRGIPIYIHSPQWFTIPSADLASLWKTIAHSFRYFGAPIDWVEDCEEEFLRVTLKAGLFRIIFDGLDEYVLWNQGRVEATEATKSLTNLALASESPILVTSRSSFWQSSVEQALQGNEKSNFLVYKLKPFDRNHARNYFHVKLGQDDPAVGRAMQVYDKFSPSGERHPSGNFVGRGFILHLIADLVSRPDVSPAISNVQTTVIHWVINALCEREEKRQNLPLSANVQIEILRELAEEIAKPHGATSEILRTIIEYSANPLTQEQLDSLVGNDKIRGALQDHPLIGKERDSKWVFKHEQVFLSLLAQRLMECADKIERLKTILGNLRVSGGFLADVATAVVDDICSRGITDAQMKREIQKQISAITNCATPVNPRADADRNSRTLATNIALLALSRLCPQGQQHKERTREFASYFPGSLLRRLSFSGTISSMDFGGVTFEQCIFHQVTWANCEFDSNTCFLRCDFIGGKINHCKGFGTATWDEPYLDADADAMIRSQKISEGQRKYTKEDLKHDIEQVIRKFVPKEGVGFKSVYEVHLSTGTVGSSNFRKLILEILRRYVLDENRISGVSGHAFHIKPAARDSVQHYASNGIFTGPLAEAYSELIDVLKLS